MYTGSLNLTKNDYSSLDSHWDTGKSIKVQMLYLFNSFDVVFFLVEIFVLYLLWLILNC